MKKITIGILAVALCIGSIGVGYSYLHGTAAGIEVISAQAHYPVYESLAELEADSDAIVLAKFTGDRENHEIKHGDILIDTLSKSIVDVKKVFKGDLAEGYTTVFEQGAIVNGRYRNVEGYKWMNKKGEYVLFLRINPKTGNFSMVGMHQGKYDLRLSKKPAKFEEGPEGVKKAFASEDYEYIGHELEFERLYKLKDEVVDKYKWDE